MMLVCGPIILIGACLNSRYAIINVLRFFLGFKTKVTV